MGCDLFALFASSYLAPSTGYDGLVHPNLQFGCNHSMGKGQFVVGFEKGGGGGEGKLCRGEVFVSVGVRFGEGEETRIELVVGEPLGSILDLGIRG